MYETVEKLSIHHASSTSAASKKLRCFIFLTRKRNVTVAVFLLVFLEILLAVPCIPLYFVSSTFSFVYGLLIALVNLVLFGASIFVMFLLILRFKVTENFYIVKTIVAHMVIVVIGGVTLVIIIGTFAAINLIDNFDVGQGLYSLYIPEDSMITLVSTIDFTMYVLFCFYTTET